MKYEHSNNMDESQTHHKLKQWNAKRYILYGSIYIKLKIGKTYDTM